MKQLNIRLYPPLVFVFLGILLGVSSLPPMEAKKESAIFPYENPLDFFIRSHWSAKNYFIFIPCIFFVKHSLCTFGLFMPFLFEGLKENQKKSLTAFFKEVLPSIMHTIIAFTVLMDLYFFLDEIGYLSPI